jgi:flagellar basal body-associated protein FliL
MMSKIRESLLVIIGIVMIGVLVSGLVLYITKLNNVSTEVKPSTEQPVTKTTTTEQPKPRI